MLLSLSVSAPSHCSMLLNWLVPKDEYVQKLSFSPVEDESCVLSIWLLKETELVATLVTFKVVYVQKDWTLLDSIFVTTSTP